MPGYSMDDLIGVIEDLKSQLDHCTKQNEHTELVAKEEIKRLRAKLADMTERLDLANRHLGELAHAPIMDELNEAKRELARYKTPCVDEIEVKS